MDLPAALLNVLSCGFLRTFAHTLLTSWNAPPQTGCMADSHHSGPSSKSHPQRVTVHKDCNKHNASCRGTKLCTKVGFLTFVLKGLSNALHFIAPGSTYGSHLGKYL